MATTAVSAGVPSATTTATSLGSGGTLLARAVAATRRGRGSRDNLKLRQRGHRQSPLEHALDVLEQRSLVGGNERHSRTRPAGTRGAADAMYVVLRHVG